MFGLVRVSFGETFFIVEDQGLAGIDFLTEIMAFVGEMLGGGGR